MKKALFLGLIFCASLLSAQDYPTQHIQGKKYYVHVVEQGNTLYAISKKYAVQINRILESNPESEEGLRIGQALLIPVEHVNRKEAKIHPQISGDYLLHTTQKGETLFSISKKYNLSINSLMDANPEVSEGLKKGQELRIPVSEVEINHTAVLEPAIEDSLQLHMVKPKETLYGIAKLYEVSIEDIQAVNGGLQDGLRLGTYIRIPKKEQINLPDPESGPTLTERPESTFEGFYNVSLVLPFALEANDSLSVSKRDIFKLTDIAMEFYRGARIATEEAKEKGMNINLFTYDLTTDMNQIEELVKNSELENSDLIIGPFHKEAFEELSKIAEVNKITIVAPVIRADEILSGKYVSKALPDSDSQLQFLSGYVLEKNSGSNFVAMNSRDEKDEEDFESFVKYFSESKKTDSRFMYDTLRVSVIDEKEQGEQEDLLSKLRADVKNVIIVPSNQQPYVSDLITKLTSRTFDKYDIEIYGMEKWIKYDNIDALYKNRFHLRLCSSKFIDYDSDETIAFMNKFYELYQTIPTEEGYGFSGYAVTNYFLDVLRKWGKEGFKHLDENQMASIYTDFNFVKHEKGGWENHNFMILKYDNFELLREY